MGVLKKKISLQSDREDIPNALPVIWEEAFKGLLPIAESLMSQVTWSVGEYAIDVMDMGGVCKAYKSKALYYGFGSKASELDCIIAVQPKLSGLLRKCSFNKQIESFGGIDVKDPGRLDFLLPSLLVDKLAEAVRHIGLQYCGQDWSSKLTEINSHADFDNMCPSTAVSKWAKISATLNGGLGRKIKGEEFSLHITMPYADIAPSLLGKSKEAPAADQRIDLDKCKPEIKRHLEQTPMAVRVVLEDIELTVAECTRLHVGQVLDLPGVSVSNLRLEAGGDQQRAYLAGAELGIYKSHRAVRLNQDVAKAFVDNLVFENL